MGACNSVFTTLELRDLKAINRYKAQSPPQQESLKIRSIGQDILGNNYGLIKEHKQLILQLCSLSGKRFQDEHFQVRGSSLSRMYNYERKNMVLFDSNNHKGTQIFDQTDLELSYLSCVLYFLCSNKKLLEEQILTTKQINSYNAYAFNLSCNGKAHTVIVDDLLPESGDKLIHSHLKGKQIWPVLLEKAWCKQIGGYQNAKGLSPEECFEEILGIPAYSYELYPPNLHESQHRSHIHQIGDTITNSLKQGFWLCVVAREGLNSPKSKQVFQVDSWEGETLLLTSAFANFSHPENQYKRSAKSHELRIGFTELIQMFEFLVVGFYKQGYSPVSLNVKSGKRQERVLEIFVKKSEEINIRFLQYYEGYLPDASKVNYSYSPLVVFELYDNNKFLLTTCQGCPKASRGYHSSHISKDIFHSLQPGKYYLRLEVEWCHEDLLNCGSVVVYASKENVEMSEILSPQQEKATIHSLHENSLHQMPNAIDFTSQNNQYRVRILEKQVQAAVSISNLLDQELCLQLCFKESRNIRIKYAKLKSNKVNIKIPPKGCKIFEIVPEDMSSRYEIKPFDIKIVSVQ